MLLSKKLPIAAAILTIFALAIASIAAIFIASGSLEKASYEKLSAIADGRRNQLDTYLGNIEKELVTVSARKDFASAMRSFDKTWAKIEGKPESELQNRYIHNNSHPIGEKQKLITANVDSYDASHKRYHERFRELQQSNNYYNVFLMNLKGDVVYSVIKELDFATNLKTGKWKSSGLATVYNKLLENLQAKRVVFSDYQNYGPSNDAPASFIATPVTYGDKVVGIIAYEMSADLMNGIFSNNTGLGETGETVLVNKFGKMITNSKFTEVNDTLANTVNLETIARVGEFKVSTGQTSGYRDMVSETAVTTARFQNAGWQIVALIEKDEALAGVSSMRNAIIIASLLTFSAALVAAYFFARTITKPIDRIVSKMSILASGDTNFDLSTELGNDEIGGMADAVEVFRQAAIHKTELEIEAEKNNQLTTAEREQRDDERMQAAEKIETVVSALASALDRLAAGDLTVEISEPFDKELDALRTNFNSSIAQLRSTLAQISDVSASVNNNLTDMRQSADSLSNRTETQGESLEEIATAVTQITAILGESSTRATEAAGVAKSANSETEKSSQIVSDAIIAMSRIEECSSQISGIISVIDEIAFQTNLLALNAGVEAARAGESGKGFAVVAQEVRDLAQRSATSAQEIKELISNSEQEVGKGVVLVKSTGEALETISSHVREMDQAIDTIAIASREQLTGVEQVNTAINDMNVLTQQNTAMVEETTAVTHTMGDDANDLNSLINGFKLDKNQLSREVKNNEKAFAA